MENRKNLGCRPEKSNICEMNCKLGYYNDHKLNSDPLSQRCVSNNCREIADTPETCVECWLLTDMQDFQHWAGRGDYQESFL
jgi:hypothetical protein